MQQKKKLFRCFICLEAFSMVSNPCMHQLQPHQSLLMTVSKWDNFTWLFQFFQDLVLCQPTSCYYLFQYLLVNLSFSVMKPQLSAEVVFGRNVPSKNTFSIFKTSCWLFYCMWKFLQMKIYQIRQNIDVKSCGTIFSNPVFCQCILIIQ